MVTIARSRSQSEPFLANPANPILTHRSTAGQVQKTGHADFVEGPDGTWAAVYLGVRIAGRPPSFHVNARETFLAGIDWVDDWPIIDEDRFPVTPSTTRFEDTFASEHLDQRWISPGVLPQNLLTRVEGGVRVGPAAIAPAVRALVAVRATAPRWRAEADSGSGNCRLTVRLDDAHWAAVELTDDAISARAQIGPLNQVLASHPRPDQTVVTLVLQAAPEAASPWATAPDILSFGYLDATGTLHELAAIDGRYFSTEVAGGFTGRVVGIEPVDPTSTTGTISRFRYETLPDD